MLKAQKKAEAEAAKANVISLEEFLEVEVSLTFYLRDDIVTQFYGTILATQAGAEFNACDTRIVCEMEEVTYG